MTKETKISKNSERSFSPFYEKIIPVAITTIVIIITGMLVLTLGIALGLIPTG
ncbi:MAG: hypothetical protein P8Y72_12005 [Anaerolineales bacterium]|jgi:glutamate mutase epsilon subunit